MKCVPVRKEDSYVFEGIIEDGLRQALKNSHDLVTFEGIIENIVNGNFGLWMVLEHEAYVGFVITQIMPEERGNWVNIAWMYAKPGYDIYKAAQDVIVPTAKEWGFAGVKFISSREGFERVAKKLGYKKRFVEYVVEEFSEETK